MAEFPHPDLIQSGVKQATQGNRYQFYAGACYLLYASTAAMQGASGLTVKFFTNENPDADGGDELKAVLPAPSIREDAPDLYFPHGLYIEVEGVNGNSDVALVEANWVARADYCRAYPQVAETLTKCWSETRPDDPFLSKFDEGAPDDGDWDNEGAAGSGGVSGAPKVSIFTTDPTVNDDSAAGYSAGDLWVNSTDDTVFVLADATAGAAVWTEIGSGGGAASWGSITGTLSNQTDLQAALDAKLDITAGAVLESDFSSAKTILVQQSGTGSPETLSVDQNTLVGRTSGASSSIDSLTATEVRSLINVADGAEVNPAVPTQAQAEDVSSSTEYSWTPERVKNVADVTPRNESMVYVFTVSSTNFPASANVPVYMAEQNETIDSVYVVPSHTSSGSSGSNNWAIDVKKTGGTSLCSTVYDTSTSELVALTPRTLGVDQNNTLGAEDVLYINIVKTGTPTNYQHKTWTFVIKTRKTPAT